MDDAGRKTGPRTGGEPQGPGPDPTPSARGAAEAWAALGPSPNAATPGAETQDRQSGRIVFRTAGAAEEVQGKMLAHDEMHAEASWAVGLALALSHLPPGPWSTTTLPPRGDDLEREVGER